MLTPLSWRIAAQVQPLRAVPCRRNGALPALLEACRVCVASPRPLLVPLHPAGSPLRSLLQQLLGASPRECPQRPQPVPSVPSLSPACSHHSPQLLSQDSATIQLSLPPQTYFPIQELSSAANPASVCLAERQSPVLSARPPRAPASPSDTSLVSRPHVLGAGLAG